MSPTAKTSQNGSTPPAAAPVLDEELIAEPDMLEHPAPDTVKAHVVPAHRTLAEVPAKLARVREIAQIIRDDMANDVARLDGAPLNGRTVAEIHADLAAAIVGVCNCLDALAQVIS